MDNSKFDWSRFTGLQYASVVSWISLLVLICAGTAGFKPGPYWIALGLNAAHSLFSIVYVAFPRKDGSWRALGGNPD